MVRQVSHAFIILVLKKEIPNSIRDYRPITRCSILFKCIDKILANRIKRVLPDIISEN